MPITYKAFYLKKLFLKFRLRLYEIDLASKEFFINLFIGWKVFHWILITYYAICR